MNKFRRLTAALTSAVCAASALPTALAPMTAVAANELEVAIENSSGLDIDYARGLQYSLYFYDANMCGLGVDTESRFAWRGDCHTYDAKVPLKPMEDNIGTNLSDSFIAKYKDILDPDGDGYVDVNGGYHDAGDHVEFGMPENYSAATVAWGYYEFRDSYIQIGEQEHIETILRHFSDYLMRCTFRDENGDVIAHCYQVGDGDIDHKYWNSPEMDEMARPAFFCTVDSPQTDYPASAAASLAINYLNFKDTDPEYAEKNLDYAKALFAFAKDHPKELSDNADGPKGYYKSNKWEDDYCWAAAWLYKITGDHDYLEEIYPNYDYYAAPCYVHCWNDVWGGVQCILGEISMDTPAKEGEHVYPDFIDEFKVAAEKSPYEEMNCWASVEKAINTYMTGGVGTITPQGYWWLNTWGSCRYNTAAQLMALVYTKYNGNTTNKYSDWAKKQMDYIMGDNDIEYLEGADENGDTHGSRSFIVGYNDHSAKYPHHRASSGLTKCEDPDPQRYVLFGALAGGPDESDKHNDITKDWIYNEVTIDYNAALPGACAGLLQYYGTPDMAPTKDFPPAPTFSGGDESGNGGGYWATACGIDDIKDDGSGGVTKVSLYAMSGGTKKAEDLTIRYYFCTKGMSTDPLSIIKVNELYDQAATEAAPADLTISGPYKWDKMSDIYYAEIKCGDYNFANSGKKYQFSVGLYYGDSWDPTDDPSYKDLKMFDVDDAFFGTGNEVRTDNICIYDNGVLVGGIEPDGTVPELPEATPTEPVVKPTEAPDRPTPTAAPTTSGSASGGSLPGNGGSSSLPGDANTDKKINVADAVAILQFVANKTKYELSAQGADNADVDGATGITGGDAIAVQKYDAGIVKALPIK